MNRLRSACKKTRECGKKKITGQRRKDRGRSYKLSKESPISKWQDAVAAAIEAEPQDMNSAKPVLGGVLQNCKGCHDNYRIEDE